VTGPSAKSVKVDKVNNVAGTFAITVSGVTSKSGIEKVQIPVWSKSDQSDIVWYTAKKQSDGTYKVTVNISKHNYNYGNYKIHVYVTDKNGIRKVTNSTTQKLSVPTPTIAVKGNTAQTEYTASVKNLALAGGVKKVQFAVWSAAGGQDDLVWYDSSNVSTGKWQKTISISKHKSTGKYYVHVYATTKKGKLQFIGSTTFTVK